MREGRGSRPQPRWPWSARRCAARAVSLPGRFRCPSRPSGASASSLRSQPGCASAPALRLTRLLPACAWTVLLQPHSTRVSRRRRQAHRAVSLEAPLPKQPLPRPCPCVGGLPRPRPLPLLHLCPRQQGACRRRWRLQLIPPVCRLPRRLGAQQRLWPAPLRPPNRPPPVSGSLPLPPLRPRPALLAPARAPTPAGVSSRSGRSGSSNNKTGDLCPPGRHPPAQLWRPRPGRPCPVGSPS